MSVAVAVRNEEYERSLQDQEQANGSGNDDGSKASANSSSNRSQNSIRIDQWQNMNWHRLQRANFESWD